MRRWMHLMLTGAMLLPLGRAAVAQSLDEQLDQDRFLRGLSELGLHDLVDYALESNGSNDAAMPQLVAISHLQATLADAALSGEERRQTIDRLIEARRGVIEQFANDPRVPQWQADLAFNLLFLRAPQNGLDLTVEFGVPGDDDRRRMGEIADEAMRLIDDAMVGLSDEILDLEEDEDFASSAAMQQRHRYLLQVEQRQRLPFLNAVALYYKGAMDGGEAPADQWKQVADTLAPLVGELAEPWLSRARSIVGVSHVHAGRFEEARAPFNAVLNAPGADAASVMRAKFGSVELLRASDGRPAAARALDQLASSSDVRRDPFMYLLVCDQRFVDAVSPALAQAGAGGSYHAATGEAAKTIVAQAVKVYQAYLDNDLLPLNSTQRSMVVADRWRAVLPDSIPLADLPPAMALAQAERMSSDPQRQAEAMNLLETLLEKNRGDATIAPRLMLALADIHAQRGEVTEAAQLWLDTATRFPLSAEAQPAVERAAALLSAAVLDAPDSQPLADLYDAALALIVEDFPQAAAFDRWAYERGLLLMRQDRFAEAAHCFELVASESDLHIDAAFQLAQARWREAKAQPGGTDRDRLMAETAGAADRVVRLIDAALSIASKGGKRLDDLRYYRVAAQVRAAQADRERREYDAALKRLEGLEEQAGVDDALAAEIIDTRISVLEALNRTEQIESDLRELADHAPQRALAIITRIATQRLAEAKRLLDGGDEQGAMKMARERIKPIAALGWSIAQPLDHSNSAWAAAGLCQAEALRLSAEYQAALEIYEQILVWRESSAEAILGRCECLFALEQWAEALPGYQRLASATTEMRSDTFWLAELRILQIFDKADRNTDRIYPTIQRLRLIDPKFGGARYRKEFAVLEDRYAPK